MFAFVASFPFILSSVCVRYTGHKHPPRSSPPFASSTLGINILPSHLPAVLSLLSVRSPTLVRYSRPSTSPPFPRSTSPPLFNVPSPVQRPLPCSTSPPPLYSSHARQMFTVSARYPGSPNRLNPLLPTPLRTPTTEYSLPPDADIFAALPVSLHPFLRLCLIYWAQTTSPEHHLLPFTPGLSPTSPTSPPHPGNVLHLHSVHSLDTSTLPRSTPPPLTSSFPFVPDILGTNDLPRTPPPPVYAWSIPNFFPPIHGTFSTSTRRTYSTSPLCLAQHPYPPTSFFTHSWNIPGLPHTRSRFPLYRTILSSLDTPPLCSTSPRATHLTTHISAREESSTVMSNCSVTFLKVGDFLTALVEARYPINLKHQWDTSHLRKVKTLIALQGGAGCGRCCLHFEPNSMCPFSSCAPTLLRNLAL